MNAPDCFLCVPDPTLALALMPSVHAMVGLGPVTATYALLASRAHIPSFADLGTQNPSAIHQIIEMRRRLEQARGPLLMTEHGRVPICRHEDQHEQHCFHAHALLFGIEGAALNYARSYYAQSAKFMELEPALAHAAGGDAYMLLSENSKSYEMLSSPLNAPRQLARTLAALVVGDIENADWRRNPRRLEAQQMAAAIRTDLGKS